MGPGRRRDDNYGEEVALPPLSLHATYYWAQTVVPNNIAGNTTAKSSALFSRRFHRNPFFSCSLFKSRFHFSLSNNLFLEFRTKPRVLPLNVTRRG
jgi:hypothetical protein